MKHLLLVDFNNLLFRYLDINSNLTFRGKQTGGVYGFVTLLASIINNTKPDSIIICNDKPPYKRKKLYPDYKSNRVELKMEKISYINTSKKYAKEVLSALNIPLWEEQGYECDDLMGILVTKNRHTLERITIVSNDSDLYSLLNTNVSIFKNKGLYTMKDFTDEYDILPSEWCEIISMCGSHNGVKGLYKGLGIKTALKIFKDKDKMDKIKKDYNDKFLLNLSAVVLPIDFDIDFKVEKLKPFSIRKIENLLMTEYGIIINKAKNDCFSYLIDKSLED